MLYPLPPLGLTPAQVEQEAGEVNKIRRKLVLRVEDVLQQEYQARIIYVAQLLYCKPVRK